MRSKKPLIAKSAVLFIFLSVASLISISVAITPAQAAPPNSIGGGITTGAPVGGTNSGTSGIVNPSQYLQGGTPVSAGVQQQNPITTAPAPKETFGTDKEVQLWESIYGDVTPPKKQKQSKRKVFKAKISNFNGTNVLVTINGKDFSIPRTKIPTRDPRPGKMVKVRLTRSEFKNYMVRPKIDQ